MILMEESMKRILTITLLAMMLLGMLAMTACKPKPEIQETEEVIEEAMDEAHETAEEAVDAAEEAVDAAKEAAEVTK